jgi:hypothetical protein
VCVTTGAISGICCDTGGFYNLYDSLVYGLSTTGGACVPPAGPTERFTTGPQ